ncbi:MAG: sugar phosphate isomerase/epimerase [bacterium]
MNNRHAPDIRIGTLVSAGMKSPEYIAQILPQGFESFSLTFWQTTDGIDWPKLADGLQRTLENSGAVVSSLGVFGNPLETGPKDLETVQAWEAAIDNAHRFGCDIVAGFAGRLRNRPIDESMPRFKEVFGRLAKRAADKGVRIAFENCDMGGSWQTGDWNIAHNPVAWEMMFHEVPDSNLGLEWEPCHQLVNLMDPLPQLQTWARKIFHMHGKDATIFWDRIRKYGIRTSVHEDIARKSGSQGAPPFAYHRTPGFGDSDWTAIISILRMNGFKGSIDIEGWHDPVMKDDLEMTGQVAALKYLKQCRGEYVGNPVV